ncbi:MAG: hypothetical protein KH415_17945 [Clostridium sp.]|nr:hypothetical protein [Clostridium sp.]
MSLGGWLWDSFLQPIASWTGGVIVSVLNGLADMLSNIGKWIGEHKPLIEDLILVIGSFALAWGLVTGALNLWNIAIGIWNSVGAIATVVTTGFGAAMSYVNIPILIAIAAIGAVIAIGVLLYKHWDVVKAKAIEIWNGIKETISKFCDNVKESIEQFKNKVLVAWDNIKNKFNEFKEWLGGVFSTDWSQRFGIFGSILNGFLANVRNTFNSVKQVFDGIINFVAGVFTGNWSRAWQGVKDIFGGIMSGLGAVIKSPLNAVISLINGAINGLNRISVDIPSWVPGFGGKSFGINIPNIPMLAKGGLIDSPTLAMIGETNKKEAVVPLEGDTKALSLIADKLMEKLGGTNISSGEKDRAIQIILKLGDIEFARALIDSINKLTEMNNGECLINL